MARTRTFWARFVINEDGSTTSTWYQDGAVVEVGEPIVEVLSPASSSGIHPDTVVLEASRG